MKNILWGAVAVVAIVLIIFFVRGRDGEQEQGEPLVSSTDGQNTVVVADQEPGSSVTVDLVVLVNSGFVVIHEDADGAPGADIGHSAALIGSNQDVVVSLERPSRESETLHAMLHRDANDNSIYEFPGADVPLKDKEGKVIVVPFQIKGEAAAEVESRTEVEVGLQGSTVTYSASGFSPATLTVKKGATVTFKNQSASQMWVASAIHPTHTVYPGSGLEKCGTAEAGGIFDACRGLAAGGEYKFTFNETGSWAYHNHLQASHTGRINVE